MVRFIVGLFNTSTVYKLLEEVDTEPEAGGVRKAVRDVTVKALREVCYDYRSYLFIDKSVYLNHFFSWTRATCQRRKVTS